MKTYGVTFLPDGKTVTVRRGASIMEAANAAGVPINHSCGGEGACGKCLVRVRSGKVDARPSTFVSPLEDYLGVVLACQTPVEADLVVEVPLDTRVGEASRSNGADNGRFGRVMDWVGRAAAFQRDPLAHRVYVELPAPDETDSISDQERVLRHLRDHLGLPTAQMSLPVLRDLPSTLRHSDWKVTLLLGDRDEVTEVVDVEGGDTSSRDYAVALDVGTTTLAAHLVDINTSATVSTVAKYNSQIRFGDDVIARIMYAKTRARQKSLQKAVVDDVNQLIAALSRDAGIRPRDIACVLCAGNTTMIHLLLGLDPAQIRRDPYVPCASAPPTVRATEVGIRIHPRGLLKALPSVSSYVGGDIVADVLAAGMTSTSDVSLLIDLGTNSEVALGSSEWMVCCSASAGPAFEGGGITCGMHATNGAVESLELAEDGRVLARGVVGGGKPLGLCGSGLVDAVGELLRVGCIDRRGRFLAEGCGQRLREGESGGSEFLLFCAEETAHGRDIAISEADIRNLIHAKGAIYLAAECMLEHLDMTFADVSHIYIAGGFGNHLRIDSAIAIGLLPDVDPQVFRIVGNGSVQGAKMALLSREAWRYLKHEIADSMTYLELSTNHKYMNEYSSCLFLPHTNIEKFPSLKRRDYEDSGRRKGWHRQDHAFLASVSESAG